ncbi:flagellar biosynthetic protein FliR [Acidithiobacillus caldus]|uniref:flagellar biosynthetic protein FliR n=1 Tax=Acidithiobacillus caldus TaxID=33059 RepID=UPI001CF27892|nr:flagellar biosynthetic protein FliR [Acidithiobacillus caldus]WMT47553.1 MAG: flagellar biosynthetic protein FliR [Acidithiobacillus caldus]
MEHWIGAFFWPFVRILALLSTAPVFSASAVPIQVRVGLAAIISVAIAPALPTLPAVHFLSGAGLVLLVEQIVIGTALGFAVTLIFSAVQFAGSVISLQMGLGFSSFFDPTTGVQVPTLSNFLNLAVLLFFMALNGQLLVLVVLMRSFTVLPVDPNLVVHATAWHVLAAAGAAVFSLGMAIAAPVLGALFLVNIALGVLSKLAPQLNLFVVGFPLLIGVGLIGLYLLAPALELVVRQLLDLALNLSGRFMISAGG